MSSAQTDVELLAILNQIILIFDKFGYVRSSPIVKTIRDELASSIATKIDPFSIGLKFKSLQNAIVKDFATNQYRKKIILKFTSNFRKSMKNNSKGVKQIFDKKRYAVSIARRAHSYRNLTLLRGMVQSCAKDEEQALIGISYAYLSLLEGIFKRSLIDCYVWEKLSKKEKIHTTKLVRMDVSEIYRHFRTNRFGTNYFKGWDRIVRNAIGHSTFHYDPASHKMIYEDLYILTRGNRKIYKRTKSCSLNEMIEKYDMAESVYHAIFFTNQILRVNEVCVTLIDRHP